MQSTKILTSVNQFLAVLGQALVQKNTLCFYNRMMEISHFGMFPAVRYHYSFGFLIPFHLNQHGQNQAQTTKFPKTIGRKHTMLLPSAQELDFKSHKIVNSLIFIPLCACLDVSADNYARSKTCLGK